jgi:hypothetical protein
MYNALNTPVNSLLNRQSKNKQLTFKYIIQVVVLGVVLRNTNQLILF